MSKIKIKGFIKSKNGNNTFIEEDAIKRENSIIYNKKDTNINILLEENKIIIKRKNKLFNNSLEFIKNEVTKSKYYINSYDKYFNIKIFTKILDINSNILKIKYDLYIENEKQDEYTFELNWRWNKWT